MERVDLEERELISRQLGRVPRGEYSVARRCVHGFPQVLRVSPILDGKPFPTLYWISCPFLRRQIGELESQGWVKRLEARLAAESDLREGLERAHEEYRAARRAACAPELGPLEQGGGIGGIADRRHLKCLHLHAAHALVAANPIGEAVVALLDRIACEPEKTICSSLAGGRSRSQIHR